MPSMFNVIAPDKVVENLSQRIEDLRDRLIKLEIEKVEDTNNIRKLTKALRIKADQIADSNSLDSAIPIIKISKPSEELGALKESFAAYRAAASKDKPRTRKEVAAFINSSEGGATEREKGRRVNYGVQELRTLMDYIYSGEPQTSDEELAPTWYV